MILSRRQRPLFPILTINGEKAFVETSVNLETTLLRRIKLIRV